MDKMRQFGYQMHNMMAQVLYGRNGFDNIARTSCFTALFLAVINIFADSVVIYLLWVALIGYTTFRVLSKNIFLFPVIFQF